jgi:hypothetical protein
MSDIIPNVVVSMPSQLFTLARKFQAASNGKIFIGKIDTDPTLPENQIQVYLENEDGSTIPVAQPLIINQAGFPVYNGQIAKFVTVEGHSMAVYDSYGAQQFYYPNVLKYEPDQFEYRLGQTGGVDYINGGKAWVKSSSKIITQKIEAGTTVTNGNYTWVNERLFKIIGYSGIISSISGNIITLNGGKKAYLVDAGFHEGDVEAWGVSKDNSYVLNHELFQACIYHASGVNVDGIETTASDLFNIFPRNCVYVSINFKTKPVNILHTTKIYGLRGVGGQALNDGIEFIIDSKSNGCFEFNPKNYCTDHNEQHYYGGVISGITATVSGSGSILSFIYAKYSCAMFIDDNRAYGMEFFFYHYDGWNSMISKNTSNTSVGGFYLFRVTTGTAISNYCNYGGSNTDRIGFDYILSSEIESSNRDILTKSKYKYSRGIHSISSNMNWINNTFEHWDIGRAQYSGSNGITSDYFEGISVCVYATSRLSCVFNPLTIHALGNSNCIVMQNNNTSASGKDSVIVDMRGITTNTSLIYSLGYCVYSGSNSYIHLNPVIVKQLNIKTLGTHNGSHIKVKIDDDVNIYCSSIGDVNNSGLFQGAPTKHLWNALNTAEMIISPSVTINLTGNIDFSSDEFGYYFDLKRNNLSITSLSTSNVFTINWSNSLDSAPVINTDEITFRYVNISSKKHTSSRSRRNILRPKVNAKYHFDNCNLNLIDMFLIGDYSNDIYSVTLSLKNTNQTSTTGGIIRDVPNTSELILLTYLKNKCSIIGSEGGNNVVKVAEATL